MRIKLTVLRTAADAADVAVTVDGTAKVGELARALAENDPVPTSFVAEELSALTVRVHERASVADGDTRLVDPEAPAAETIRSGAVVSLARAAARFDDSRAPSPVARLSILEGPDAGNQILLPEGTTIIGRGADCDIRLTDPTVSKEHARVAIGDSIEIVDLRSANGLYMGDGIVQRAVLIGEDTVALGDTVIRIERIAASRHGRIDAAHVDFNRSPRLAPVYEGEEVEAPKPPEPPKPQRFPFVMLIVPLIMVPAFLAMGRGALSLVFLAMMPLMVVGGFIERTVSGKREYRAAVEQFGETVTAMRSERETERQVEQRVRRAETPAVAEIVGAAHSLEPLLWTRRPEHDPFLELRLGLGTLPSRASIKLPGRNNAVADYWNQVVQLRDDFATVDDVPATVRLRDSGALGLAGPRESVDDVARAVVAQLVALHSPAEVVLTVLASSASAVRWEWTKWLPHLGSIHSPIEGPHAGSNPAGAIQLTARIEGLIEQRRMNKIGSNDQAHTPTVVVLVEDDTPIERGRLVRLAEDGPGVGVHVVWVASAVERLPAVCRTFVEVRASAEEALAGYVKDGTAVAPVRCDRVSADQALALATHLAAVNDAGAPVEDDSDVPIRVSYLGLVGPEVADESSAVVERWRENGSLTPRDGSPPRRRRHDADLRALIGQGPTSPFTLDLRTQGPHALVGGTTGAGKSEFLQSWVLGMATAHSPDRVTFLFVDYKGGSAFADCVDLPHTVGLVTDLSPHLVRRALTSLRAELHHREHLLNRKRAKDLISLERTGDPECPPSLIIIVDEFAALATEVPEFVDGVVDVAQRGRSLGLHLILATQRPAGVIKDNLRANTNLRVALRMNDESDSKDVLGLPLAAGFDPAIPGRGAARTGPGRITMFQTGYAGGRTTGAKPKAQIDVESLVMGAGARWEKPEEPEPENLGPLDDEGPTDIARIVRTVSSAATLARVPEPRKPWLPTMAGVQDLSALGQRTDGELVLGLVDDPASQRQLPTYFRPDTDGNIAFYGASGSGKSTALRTLAIAAGITPRGGPVQVYGIDFSSGGLGSLEALPHVGSIIDGDDAERIQRLIRQLAQTAEDRSARYSAARASNIAEYREISGHRDEPRILLLIDGYGAFRSEWEGSAGRMAWYQRFVQLLVDGRSAGIHVAVTADRAGTIPSSVSGSLPLKIVMRQVDEPAYQMMGVPKDVLDASSPPGRAITPTGLEMQVAVLGGSENLAEQVRAIEKLSGTLRRAGVRQAPEIRRLPEHIPAADMPESVGGLPVLGVCDETLEPVGFEPAGTFLLAGPPQSGRTSTLRWLATSIRRARPQTTLYFLGARRSALRGLDLWEQAAVGAQECGELAKELVKIASEPPEEGQPGVVFVIETLADFLTTAAETPVTELIKAAKRNEHLVIADGETSAWASSWPLISEVRNGRRGMALQPDQVEGDALFRTSFPRVSRKEFPVGRGMVADRAKVRRIQVPYLA